MGFTQTATIRPGPRRRKTAETIFWYGVLGLIAVVTAFPFIWVLSMSLKGPNDAIYSVPPQLIPTDPTLENYLRVWRQLPMANFFLNSIVVAVGTVILNLLFTSLAAYPFAKLKF